MVEIISYNVNGIRAAVNKGLYDWLSRHSYDIVCFQEIKAQQQQLNTAAFERLGYKHFWFSAEKKGYSGVAVLTKIKPDKVVYGMGIPEYDREGRTLRLDFGRTTLINAYFPSGTTGEERQAFKMKFLADFQQYIMKLLETRSHLIISGDYNIAHKPIDIHDPIRNANSSGFLPEERQWLTGFLQTGFIDTFRHVNRQAGQYSWWTYRTRARDRNLGWRIDYHLVSKTLQNQLLGAAILADVCHSDHCPVYLKIIF